MIILVVSFKQNLNFKIQMLEENSLISFLNSRSEENSTLVDKTIRQVIFFFKSDSTIAFVDTHMYLSNMHVRALTYILNRYKACMLRSPVIEYIIRYWSIWSNHWSKQARIQVSIQWVLQ